MNKQIDAAEQQRIAAETRLPRPQDLPDLPEDDPLAPEWHAFKREIGRLLADGLEGRVALLHGGAVHSIWDTRSDAMNAAFLLFDPATVLVQEIEPVMRPLRSGYSRLCQS